MQIDPALNKSITLNLNMFQNYGLNIKTFLLYIMCTVIYFISVIHSKKMLKSQSPFTLKKGLLSIICNFNCEMALTLSKMLGL
jgi:hypothetical protein